jgi:hypothetical protein
VTWGASLRDNLPEKKGWRAVNIEMPQKKRNQHHVWQHYLKAWATDGKIFCLQNGKVFSTGTPVVAVEKDFYKLHKVTPKDLKLIHWLASEKAHPVNRKLHEHFLVGMAAPIIRFGHLAKTDKVIEKALDTFMTNALEDFYAGIEGRFIPLLVRIKAGDMTFYTDGNDALEFFYFACTQYMRTKAVRVRIIERLKQNGLPDLTHVWNLMGYLYAVNIGFGLYLERKSRKLVLVENDTGIPFVTGDQPVTNLLGNGKTGPEELVLYYPITPRLALVLGEANKEPPFTTSDITPSKVADLNARIVAASHSQIFSCSEASLAQLREQTQNHKET